MQRHHTEEVIALCHENAYLQEAHRPRQPEANPPEGEEAKSTAVGLLPGYQLECMSEHYSPFPQHFGKTIVVVQEPFHPQHHGGNSPLQLEKLDYCEI